MPLAEVALTLKVAPGRRSYRKCILSSGVEIDADLREIEHPEGRFVRPDGTRYDICLMEVISDPAIQCPGLTETFVGDRKDTEAGLVRVGFVDAARTRSFARLPMFE